MSSNWANVEFKMSSNLVALLSYRLMIAFLCSSNKVQITYIPLNLDGFFGGGGGGGGNGTQQLGNKKNLARFTACKFNLF